MVFDYKRVKGVSIKSEKEAFEELVAGKFRYYYDENIKDIAIGDINLEHILGTKKFY